MKILIVDDHEPMRRIIKSLLAQIGYSDFDEAKDGREALEKLKSAKYDLVLLDWNMPEMSGEDVLKAMRSDPELSKIPVIMVTAESSKEKVIAAIQAGANDYIVKPFNAATLKKKIEGVLKS